MSFSALSAILVLAVFIYFKNIIYSYTLMNAQETKFRRIIRPKNKISSNGDFSYIFYQILWYVTRCLGSMEIG